MQIKRIKGLSLIEMLIASSVLATVVVGLLTLQASALGTGVLSGHRQYASLLLMELAEIAQINPAAFRAIDPALLTASDVGAPVCPAESVCEPQIFLSHELSIWMETVNVHLPDAQIDIQREWEHGQIIWTVNLSWHGPKAFSQNRLQTELRL